MTRRLGSALVAGIVISLLATGCGGGKSAVELKMAPASQLPAEARSAPANVQEAYRFAIANKELLEQIPCFCGCVAGGHESNYNCYMSEDGGPGTVLQFDSHALGCGICVDITRDVMKMLQEGKTVDQMREVIYDRYGNFGPSTDEARDSHLLPADSPMQNMLTSATSEQCSETGSVCEP